MRLCVCYIPFIVPLVSISIPSWVWFLLRFVCIYVYVYGTRVQVPEKAIKCSGAEVPGIVRHLMRVLETRLGPLEEQHLTISTALGFVQLSRFLK